MTNMPITTAVYPRGASKRKGVSRPERKPRPGTLVGQHLGEEQVAELYRALGFKQPHQRPKRKRGPRRG